MSAKKLLIRILCVHIFITIFASYASADQAQNLAYDYTAGKGFSLQLGEYGNVNIGTDIECGPVRDGALYASFGIEGQIWHFTKVVFNIEGTVPTSNPDNEWFYKVDIAPLYNSIEAKSKEKIIYEKDSQGNEIDGNNFYYDWYKNFGSRTYYLGDVPLIETYLGYKWGNHKFKFGRMKGLVGIEDHEVFWSDDAKFAPMGHWLTRDLLSGATYGYKYNFAEATIGLFSGSNPAKGYSHYLDRIESPNIKSNNTPTFAGRLQIDYSDLLPEMLSGYAFTSYMFNITGSTWVDSLNDGKRNASTSAHGAVLDVHLGDEMINKLRLFGQYNRYHSGLKTDSAQNDKSKKFKDILQKGYFVGAELKLLENKLAVGAAYEQFDRFDYNLYKKFNYSSNNPYRKSQQFSRIYNVRYDINPAIAIGASYHIIKNPAMFASEVLDTRKTDRVKISLLVNL